MEVDILYVSPLLFLYPLSYHRRAVESLTYFPGLSLSSELSLQVACGEVDTHSEGIIIAVGKLSRDALSQSAYSHHEFCLIVHLFTPVGHEEGFSILQKCGVSLGEDNRLLWLI